MRRRFLLAAIALPLAGALVAYGCSDEPAVESLCDWVADPGNCFRAFRQDMKADGGTDCKPGGKPTPVTFSGTPGTTNGSFPMRAMLDTCIIDSGGSVTIDPPIDLTKIPVDPFALPVTYKITFKDVTGGECGNATYTSPHGFSITINAPPDAGIPAEAGVFDPDASFDAGDAGIHYPFGTYTEVNAPGRDTVDTTCPSGETHHFVLDEVSGPASAADGGAVSSCPGFSGLVPQALLLIDPGGIDKSGAVSFSIVYPPSTGTYPANTDPQTVPPVAPDVVTYFNCSVPGAPETCANAVIDTGETDVDCGGPLIKSGCPQRCDVGQMCVCDLDCNGGDSGGQVCAVDPMDGVKKCFMGDGTHVGHPICGYTLPPGGGGGTGGAGGTGGGGGSSSSASGTGGASTSTSTGTGGASTSSGTGGATSSSSTGP